MGVNTFKNVPYVRKIFLNVKQLLEVYIQRFVYVFYIFVVISPNPGFAFFGVFPGPPYRDLENPEFSSLADTRY